MDAETFKIVYVGKNHVFGVTLTDHFQFHSWSVDTENISWWDQRNKFKITDKYKFDDSKVIVHIYQKYHVLLKFRPKKKKKKKKTGKNTSNITEILFIFNFRQLMVVGYLQ